MYSNILKLCALPAVALIAACTTSPTTTANASDVVRIECSPTSRGLNECYQRAGKTCGAEGFSVVRSDGTVVASSAGNLGSRETIVLSAMDKDTMLVTCGSGN